MTVLSLWAIQHPLYVVVRTWRASKALKIQQRTITTLTVFILASSISDGPQDASLPRPDRCTCCGEWREIAADISEPLLRPYVMTSFLNITCSEKAVEGFLLPVGKRLSDVRSAGSWGWKLGYFRLTDALAPDRCISV